MAPTHRVFKGVHINKYVNRHLLKNNFNLEIKFFLNVVTIQPLLTNSIKSPFYFGGQLVLRRVNSIPCGISITRYQYHPYFEKKKRWNHT